MTRAILALAVLALALPAAAQAQTPKTNAPPGNSAIDEYLETVPGATGNQRPRPPARNGGDGAAVLSAAERARLERLGPDGETLADAVEATAPARETQAKPDVTLPEGEGRSPTRELLGAIGGNDGGGGGMGVVLPAILVAALLAVITTVLLRRRAAS
ncbi:MAG: hypothetical protein Q8O56_07095 [Solirubrobacteraceae bacterium]|nr:hypothetical protein [Solirubrobacteraceae bacterium]